MTEGNFEITRAVSLTIGESLYIKTEPPKKWRCPKGHEWESAFPFVMSVYMGSKTTTSKPFCPYCWLEHLERDFPAEETA